MTTFWMLTAQLIGGFTMMPQTTEADCHAALAALPALIARDGECTRIEVLVPSSPLAPELAPMPPRKPAKGPP